MDSNKGIMQMYAAIAVGLVVMLGTWGCVGYVAWHFVSKFW